MTHDEQSGHLTADADPRPLAFDWRQFGLPSRIVCLALVFSLELILLPVLAGIQRLAYQVSEWGPVIVRGAVGFAILIATFAWLKHRPALTRISAELSGAPIDFRLLTAHLFSITLFGVLSAVLYGSHFPHPQGPANILFAAVWLTTGIVSLAVAGIALIPPRLWMRMIRDTGSLWVWAIVTVLFACLAGKASQSLWPLATGITFHLSQAMLSPFVSQMVVDPVKMVIGTPRFTVGIAPVCSGLEGVGLILSFGILWLTLFRKECRFPHALLLLPAGVVIIFVLNSARIAALVLIGDAGAEQIAMRGFHSQAGWLAFSLVSLGFSVAASKVQWLRVPERNIQPRVVSRFENPTVRWVLPFVTILAAGMIAAAATGDFEWFYPLRFFAPAVTLFFLWRRYTNLCWRVSWFAPAIGVVVFLIWIGFDRFTSALPEKMPVPLAAASPLARSLWLTLRVLAATVTVPVAEELAFRGFLYRRLLSADFESVSLRRFSWLALLISSAIFGLLHGDRWFVGTVAGSLYALALIRRGSMGDAVVAHATTNALLAVDVLAFHHWHLW